MSFLFPQGGAFRWIAPLFLVLSPVTAHADVPPPRAPGCLAARVTHEEENVTSNGVERRERYRERFWRCGDQVFIERIIPENAPKAPPSHSSRDVDLERVARWFTPGPQGAAQVVLVDRTHRQLIELSRGEYAEIGFSGEWDEAAHLLPQRLLRGLKEVPGSKPGIKRYEGRDGHTTVTVEWLEKEGLPKSMDVQSDDGARHSHLMVELEPGPKPGSMPWEALRDWTRKEFTDLGD